MVIEEEAGKGAIMNEQMSLFDTVLREPLPARLRPQNLDEIVGQQHLLGPGRILRRIIEQDAVSSMIFWGPPGVGKTTLANVIAHQTQAGFINFSAVTSWIKEIRTVMQKASYSWMRSTASIKRSRTPSCRLWKRGALF